MREVHTIEEWRRIRGITQFQLAVRAEIGLATEQGIERGRQTPRLDVAQRIAIALGCGVDDIRWPEVKKQSASNRN